MVELLLATGIRVSEPAGLDLGDLDLAGHSVEVRANGGAAQVRHVRKDVAQLLKRYLKWRTRVPGVSSGLFVSAKGQRLGVRQFARRLDRWAAKASINGRVTPHTFRHTLASRLLAMTGNLRLVQQALGHRSIASTVRYTHIPSDTLRAALEAV